MKRRSFVKLLAAEAALPLAAPLVSAATTTHKVGVGVSSAGYAAANTAINASGEFPDVTGKTVIIKPNLVVALPANTGITTDPEVTRAVVDRCLTGGATEVIIIEGGPGQDSPAHFSACGYGIFSNYDPRVRLLDLQAEPASLVPVTQGLVYWNMYVATMVTQPNTVFISIGKLKTHANSHVTLSMKNLIGLAAPSAYKLPNALPRVDMHYRGIDQSIVDVCTVRPIDYAVVDGIWGMEGNGPALGTAVAFNTVLAGKNPVAVDRAGVHAMQLPQARIPHLSYATAKGLGPADMSGVQLVGDTLTPRAFAPAPTAPIVWHPTPAPRIISLAANKQNPIYFQTPDPCRVRLEVLWTSDVNPGMSYVRTLREWSDHPGGMGVVYWDGKAENGTAVAQGIYAVRIRGNFSGQTQVSFGATWIGVTA